MLVGGILGTMILYVIIMSPAIIFMLYAQYKVSSTYKKYSKVANMQRITGAQAADILLRSSRLNDVQIQGVRGHLTDHYDPRNKVLRLSEEVYTKPSVASLGIAAHEVGHAVQHNVGYAPMRARAALVPAANLGSNLGGMIVFAGLLMSVFISSEFGYHVAFAGVILFSAAVLFTLITLPVEYNASRRARQMLNSTGLVSREEANAASAVLSAAALTYVAALLSAVATLFFYVLLLLGMRR